jgi:hypothetical protein
MEGKLLELNGNFMKGKIVRFSSFFSCLLEMWLYYFLTISLWVINLMDRKHFYREFIGRFVLEFMDVRDFTWSTFCDQFSWTRIGAGRTTCGPESFSFGPNWIPNLKNYRYVDFSFPPQFFDRKWLKLWRLGPGLFFWDFSNSLPHLRMKNVSKFRTEFSIRFFREPSPHKVKNSTEKTSKLYPPFDAETHFNSTIYYKVVALPFPRFTDFTMNDTL